LEIFGFCKYLFPTYYTTDLKYIFCLIILAVGFFACKKDKHAEDKPNALCLDTALYVSGVPATSVFFTDGKNGYIGAHNGGIYKTTDSAKSWLPLSTGNSLPVYDIFFTDALQGIAVGGQNFCSGSGCTPPGGFVLRTTDGGITWTRVHSVSMNELSSVYFVNASTGYAAGDNVVLKTTDGGISWRETRIPDLGGKMMQVKFTDAQNGYIVCMFDKIVKTTDGGGTWRVSATGFNQGYYSLSTAAGVLYASGQKHMVKSGNGGATWEVLPNSPEDIYSLHFTDGFKGFAFGRGNYSGGDWGRTYGAIYCTGDGGKSWSGIANVTQSGIIRSAVFPAPGIGYAISGPVVLKLRVK
jgi:photosystem II stability/assembly factor-like uncharacterized protein